MVYKRFNETEKAHDYFTNKRNNQLINKKKKKIERIKSLIIIYHILGKLL